MPRFEAKASDNGEELDLIMSGYVGKDWYGDGSTIDATNVIKALNANKGVKTIRNQINTAGGDVSHALAIHSALRNHGAKVITMVHGLVASAGTVIASAADEINIGEESLYMIHEVRGGQWGTAEELEAEAAVIRKMNDVIAAIYVARTGKSDADIRKMMADETWMTGAEALANGFVTATKKAKPMAAHFSMSDFRNVPERVKPLLASLMPPSSGNPPEGAPIVLTQPAASAATSTPAAPPAASPSPAPAAAPAAAPTAAAPASPPAPTAAPVAAAATDPVMAERNRCAQITAACQMAKRPDMAPKFIEDSNATVASVQGQLLAIVCQSGAPQADAGAGPGAPAPADPNSKYVAEFKEQEKVYKNMGLTEESYVKSRRKDDGLD